jgi:hypothetical protein
MKTKLLLEVVAGLAVTAVWVAVAAYADRSMRQVDATIAAVRPAAAAVDRFSCRPSGVRPEPCTKRSRG